MVMVVVVICIAFGLTGLDPPSGLCLWWVDMQCKHSKPKAS